MKITSQQNPGIKNIVKLRNRQHRDRQELIIVEGFREISRALDNGYVFKTLYFCTECFQGENEPALIDRAQQDGADLLECSKDVFCKISYRDRPEGLLGLGPKVTRELSALDLPDQPFLLVTEHIEKPGNLGTMLRAADAAGVDAVIVCDPCTDIHNPNVVRASVGTLFSVPVVEASSADVQAWLDRHGVQIVAATPYGSCEYTGATYSGPTAVVVGSEMLGLSDCWMGRATVKVKIPMLGQCDSLNVSAAAAIMLYEVVRQRSSV